MPKRQQQTLYWITFAEGNIDISRSPGVCLSFIFGRIKIGT